jgi:DNA-binding MarR family transcriptional regulator
MDKLKLDLSEYQAINKIDVEHNISCNEIAKIIGLSVSRSSRVIDKMVKKQILKREASETDKRSKLVSLTEKGIKIKLEIEKNKALCEKKIAASFKENELKTLESDLTKLIDAL